LSEGAGGAPPSRPARPPLPQGGFPRFPPTGRRRQFRRGPGDRRRLRAFPRRAGGDQRGDIVLALGVEAVIEVGHLLAQHAIGAHPLGAPPTPTAVSIAMIDHEQMVENRIEDVLIAQREHGDRARACLQPLARHLFAHALRPPRLMTDLGSWKIFR